MTLEKYRILHSTLIEQYQWIEFDLEGLYAALSEEPFFEALQEIEKDSIGGVVREIQRIENQRNLEVFSREEYQALDRIREQRNFWCHVCYTECYDKHTKAPKNADLLAEDLKKAEEVLAWVRKTKTVFMEEAMRKPMKTFCWEF